MPAKPKPEGASFATNLAHRCADLLNEFILDFQLLERHFLFPDGFWNLILQFEDVVALESERDAAKRTRITRIAIFESGCHDAQVEYLIQTEHEHELICPIRFSQGFDGFLLRKTCGAGSSSDEAGCCFVYDFGAGCFDTMTHGKARDIVAFAKDRHFLTF